jgi:uncharacterized membrane protein
MEKMIQALFDSETEAFKGLQALQQLDLTEDISVGELYVLTKDENGAVALRTAKDEHEGYATIGGGIIGGLVGLLAGPLGLLVGIGAGMVVGSAGDTVRAEGVSDYLDKVAVNIPAGKSLLLAHVWEDWEAPIDTVLQPISNDIRRVNLDAEVFTPVRSEMDRLSEDITKAETEYLGADEEDKARANEKLLLLKIERENLVQKLHGSISHQEKQYTTWVDNHHSRSADRGVEHVLHEKEKRDLLEARLNEQKSRLEMLRKNR